MNGTQFSQELIAGVRRSGVPQQELAARLGISPPLLSNWMHGRHVSEAQFATVRALARLIGVSFEAALVPRPVTHLETVTVAVPLALLDDLEFYARQRGLTCEEAMLRAFRGFIASCIVAAREAGHEAAA